MRRGELAVGAAIAVAGFVLGASTYALPEGTGVTAVGPKLFPALIAAGLSIVGLLLVREAWAGGFRNLPVEERDPLDWAALAWISGGVLVHMALIGSVGFILASTLLFMAVARGFGSARWLRDGLIGLAMAAVLYAIFTYALGLGLGPIVGMK